MRIPERSLTDAARWPLATLGNLSIQLLSSSNLTDEPFANIGSGWFTDDLRYPAFLSQSYSYFFFMLFINDMSWAFNSVDELKAATFLLRPWKNIKGNLAWMGWQENFKGICCLAYIYFGYWVRRFTELTISNCLVLVHFHGCIENLDRKVDPLCCYFDGTR